MTDKPKSETDHLAETRAKVLAAALPHVDFDGWSEETLQTAIDDSGVDAGLAKLAFPRGALDLALAFHFAGDAEMVERLAAADLSDMRFRDRIAFAIQQRLEVAAPHREAVRRGMSFFAMPANMADGSKALWHTADVIWKALGDTSTDLNFYSKRTTLSAVYSACVLYWLGDESRAFADTWAFIDRRIDNVMQFEKFKAKVRENPLGKAVGQRLGKLFENIRAPGHAPDDLPGRHGS
ncbi:MAG TPA: COQ9 family protein [Paracoccaceae bacterium]|nr:COQ9 family protein [Paracoccaceae bacterium]